MLRQAGGEKRTNIAGNEDDNAGEEKKIKLGWRLFCMGYGERIGEGRWLCCMWYGKMHWGRLTVVLHGIWWGKITHFAVCCDFTYNCSWIMIVLPGFMFFIY